MLGLLRHIGLSSPHDVELTHSPAVSFSPATATPNKRRALSLDSQPASSRRARCPAATSVTLASFARTMPSASACASPGGNDDSRFAQELRNLRVLVRRHDEGATCREDAAEFRRQHEVCSGPLLRDDVQVGKVQEVRQPLIGFEAEQTEYWKGPPLRVRVLL